MYKSDIAENLKIKIDNEMSNLVNNTNLISLTEKVSNIKSKEELKAMKAQLISYNDYVTTKKQTLEKPKVLVKKLKNAGFVNNVFISLLIIFIMMIAFGIGYLFHRFGM